MDGGCIVPRWGAAVLRPYTFAHDATIKRGARRRSGAGKLRLADLGALGRCQLPAAVV